MVADSRGLSLMATGTVPVRTVDSFQGQEADIVIFSGGGDLLEGGVYRV